MIGDEWGFWDELVFQLGFWFWPAVCLGAIGYCFYYGQTSPHNGVVLWIFLGVPAFVILFLFAGACESVHEDMAKKYGRPIEEDKREGG